jgi:hypothetical protein
MVKDVPYTIQVEVDSFDRNKNEKEFKYNMVFYGLDEIVISDEKEIDDEAAHEFLEKYLLKLAYYHYKEDLKNNDKDLLN